MPSNRALTVISGTESPAVIPGIRTVAVMVRSPYTAALTDRLTDILALRLIGLDHDRLRDTLSLTDSPRLMLRERDMLPRIEAILLADSERLRLSDRQNCDSLLDLLNDLQNCDSLRDLLRERQYCDSLLDMLRDRRY